MANKIIGLVAVVSWLGGATLLSQEGTTKPAEGTLMLEKKTYPLKHALAFETTIDNEDAITVVLSGKPVAGEKVKEARENDKNSTDTDFGRPFLKLVFKKSGEFKHWSAAAGGTLIGRRTVKLKGQLNAHDGRVSGSVNLPEEGEGMFRAAFDARFDVALLKAGDAPAPTVVNKPGPAANVPPSVSGIFKGNGTDAKLAFVSARWGEPFSGKTGIVLIFTEKDHSKDKRPDWNAAFGKFGSGLVISLHEDGSIYGCQVAHSAHKKQGFSSIGKLEATDFTFADGKIEGELTTNGESDTFGETWEVKIKFVAPLGEIPKEFQVPESKKEEKPVTAESPKKPAATDSDDDGDDDDVAAVKPKAGGLKAKELALTKDASEIEYKEMVEHVLFKSKADVKAVCAELSASLKAQGWTNDGSDMIQPQSAILKRKRGGAKLTIFVKPGSGGSQVQMFTEGLDWQ
ncbi:MAG TPA: hypothetical protein VM940_04330 [Chthoniobacterales bacterium]|nr:hypothetical protein [Chthoniobacterales bacterium]